MSDGEWTVLVIYIGLLVGTSVYNTLVLNRLPKTAKWNEVKLANPYKWAFKCSNCGEIQICGVDLCEYEDERPDWDPIKARGLHYCPHCGAKMEKGESLRQ